MLEILSTFSWLLVALDFTMMVVYVNLITRLTVLLPAIAVDAPGAGWANAYGDTEGYTLRIFMAYVVGFVLIVLAGLAAFGIVFGGAIIVGVATSSVSAAEGLARVIAYVFMAALLVVYVTFFVALTSRAFEAVANRMKAPQQIFQR